MMHFAIRISVPPPIIALFCVLAMIVTSTQI